MPITVRRATAEDAPALARLRWQVDNGEGAGVDRATFLEYFTTWAMDNLATHLPFVAEADGRLVGVAWLALYPRVPTPSRLDRRTGDVQSVYVVPEARNAGVGTALLDAVLREARDRELTLVTVHANERAASLYRRSGFRDDQLWFEWQPE